MSRPRFSKATTLEAIEAMAELAKIDYQFCTGKDIQEHNGWSQVPAGNDAAQRAYGRWAGYCDLIDQLELS